jgi:manganese transport system ATP-binding protein
VVDGQAPSVTARDAVLVRGGHVALRGANLDLPSAAVTAVVGPNGSGKSTLLHAIAGLIRPESGELRVLGHRPEDVRARVAYVLQSTVVREHLPITVGEVVTMGRYAARGAMGRLRAPDRAAVADAVERLELGDVLHRHVGELSGGQRQRVFVAQGLAQDADVLLLDEPVTGLDVASVQRIREVVAEERAAGRTVVVATHDLAEASSADYLVLVAGRVVAAGTPDRALTRDTLSEAYGSRLLRVHGATLLLDDGAHHHGVS